MARHSCVLAVFCLLAIASVLAQPPAYNTECNLAQPVILGTEYTFVTSSNTGTSRNPTCGISNDVWFNVTSTCSSLIQFSLCGSEFDTNVAIYPSDACGADGSIENKAFACNDDSQAMCGGGDFVGQSFLTWSSSYGQRFLIRVGGFKSYGVARLVVSCSGDIVLVDDRTLVPSVDDAGSITKFLLKDADYVDLITSYDFFSTSDGHNLFPLIANVTQTSISVDGTQVVSSGDFYIDGSKVAWSSTSKIESNSFAPHTYTTKLSFRADEFLSTNARVVASLNIFSDTPKSEILVVPPGFPSDESNKVLLWQNKGAFFGYQTDGSVSDFEGWTVQKKGSSLPPFSKTGGMSGVSTSNSTAFPEFSQVYGPADLTVSFCIKLNGIGEEFSDFSSVTFFVSPSLIALNESYDMWQSSNLTTNSSNGVLANDLSYSNEDLAAAFLSISSGSNKSITINADGSFTYTPKSNWVGVETIKYIAKSGSIDRAIGYAFITVREDDRPRPENDYYTIVEKQIFVANFTIGVLANDLPHFDVIKVTSWTQPMNGTVVGYSNGSFTYTPNARFNGNDTFNYTIANSRGESADAFVTMTVEPFVGIPLALNDSYSVDEDEILTVEAPGVLQNDTDPEGTGNFTCVLVNGPMEVAGGNASLSLQSNGSFVYSPPKDFNGVVSFTYVASNGENVSNAATVVITVVPVNDDPVATPDHYDTFEETLLERNVLDNDIDVDGDNLTVSVVNGTGPYHAAEFMLNASGDFRYKAVANFYGEDSFTYMISDRLNRTSTALVTIQIVNVNDVPVPQNDTYELYEGATLTIEAPGVLLNDSDSDNGNLTSHLRSPAKHGNLMLYTNGSFVYTPTAFFTGNDSFVYYVFDGASPSDDAVVTLIIKEVPSAPIAMNDNYNTTEDVPLIVRDPKLGVLGNDYDPDEGDVITATLVKTTPNGKLVLNRNGTFTYTPNANFNGYDSFTYTATDGTLVSEPAIVRINVAAVNDPPVPKKDHYVMISGQVLEIDAAHGVLKNDSDVVEKQNLTIATWGFPKNGSVQGRNNGSFTYTPKDGFVGTDRFDYTVKDAGGATASSYVEIEVQKPRSAAAIIIIIVIVIICAVAGAIYFIRKRNESSGTTENPQRLFS